VLASGLDSLETWLDDQAYLKRIRNFCVINPNFFTPEDEGSPRKVYMKSFKMLLRDDPVHISCTGYTKLAQCIVDSIPDITFSRADVNVSNEQCCGSETIFFGSGSHFPSSFGSGSGSYLLAKSFGSSFGSDPKHSLFHNANDLKWLFID
jgi:hypothetical protein